MPTKGHAPHSGRGPCSPTHPPLHSHSPVITQSHARKSFTFKTRSTALKKFCVLAQNQKPESRVMCSENVFSPHRHDPPPLRGSSHGERGPPGPGGYSTYDTRNRPRGPVSTEARTPPCTRPVHARTVARNADSARYRITASCAQSDAEQVALRL